MFYVPQVTQNDCGFACLKMVLARVLKDEKYLYLPANENHGRYSYYQLSNIAQRHGVTMFGFIAEDRLNFHECDFYPLIISINTNPNQDQRHAVVVEKISGNKAKIYDPEIGVYWMSIEKLSYVWDGTGMGVRHVDIEMKKEVEEIKPVKKSKTIFSYFLQVCTGIVSIIGIYFINPNGPHYLPLVILSFAAFLEILSRLYLYNLMKDYDGFLDEQINNINPKNYYEFYKRGQEYKKISLTFGMNFVYYLIICLFVIFITLFNSLYYFPIIMSSVLLALFESLVFIPKENKKLREFEQDELLLKSAKSIDVIKKKVKTLQKGSYQFTRQILAKRIIGLLIFGLVSIAIGIFNKSFTLINVIFFVCLQIYLYKNLVSLFTYEQKKKEFLLEKVRLSNIIHQNDENK